MSDIDVGRLNCLQVVRVMSDGYLLEAPEQSASNAFLAKRHVNQALDCGDSVEVFVYADSQGRFVATTTTPRAMVGQVAFLRVAAVNDIGAFLDWGLPKELLLPYREQRQTMQVGAYCTVFVHKDPHSERVVASQRLNRHVGKTPASYSPGEEVAIHVCGRTDLGYKAVVNHAHWGLLYENEVFESLPRGEERRAWVKKVVGDDKVDLSLSPPRKQRFSDTAEAILQALEEEGGFVPLHDKSPPEAIRARFGVSKKSFKAAVGQLYKQRRITMQSDGIHRTVEAESESSGAEKA